MTFDLFGKLLAAAFWSVAVVQGLADLRRTWRATAARARQDGLAGMLRDVARKVGASSLEVFAGMVAALCVVAALGAAYLFGLIHI